MSPAGTAVRPRPAARRRRGAARPGGRRRPTRRRSRKPRLRAARWWPLVLVVLVAVVGLAWDGGADDGPMATAECTLPASGVNLTGEQLANARTIAQVGWDRGLLERAVVIALATAMQESRLVNVTHGDRDSLGLFQQRPSQGWGTAEQVQDPVYATGRFYDGLVTIDGYEDLPVTEAAQAVQRSGFPEAYAQHETRSRA